MSRFRVTVGIFCTLAARLGAAEPGVDFNRDVRPILADNCFKCHGPDEKERKAKLRLDERDAAAKRDAFAKLVGRITNPDVEQRMPPAASGKKLSAAQIEILKRWIDQGAKYSTHWAFVKPQRPPVPGMRETQATVRSAIDAFIRARLEQDGLSPSPEANRATLIRRLTFDLTGLPPTIQEID